MNYYERHLGDYAKDAGHLSMLEHGAYTLLLDRYYTTEQPIPADQAHRVCRARTKEERAAVDAVLAEFFVLVDGAWKSGRADREIAQYLETEPDREAKRENERERQRRTRERRRELFNQLRERGIVPAYDATMSELQRLLSHGASQPVTQPVTRDATATHAPDTIHQTPVAEAKASAVGTPAGAICRALRAAGIANVNPGNLRLTTLLAAGATEAEFMAHAAKAADKGDPFAYLLGAVEGERKRAAATTGQLHRGALPNKQEALEARNMAVAQAWLAKQGD